MGINYAVSFVRGHVSICVPIVFGKIKIGIIILKLCGPFSCTGSWPYERRISVFIKTLEVAFGDSPTGPGNKLQKGCLYTFGEL